MSENISRSWFAVLNNPEKNGYAGMTPNEIVEKMLDEWVADNPLKKGYWAYCISANGTPHIHMILEGSGSMRFSAVKKAYPQAHLEPTKGSKKQVISYIRKEPPFDEKGEQVICFTSYGNIEGNKRLTLSNANETLDAIERLIEDGMTPAQIMAEDIRLRKEEALIRKAYFAKRFRETPPYREVRVIWHFGDSGTGKSFTYVQLCELYGDENIYLLSDYANKGVGGFDSYCGEKILFMDEFKGSIPYELLLTIMDGYRTQIHCRYANCVALWNEVQITSIFSPEDIYSGTVDSAKQKKDTIMQLLRRITKYVYHYKENGEFKTFELSGSEYIGYEEMKLLAMKKDGFQNVDNKEIPFEKVRSDDYGKR